MPRQKQCYSCKGFGHIARNCTANLPSGEPLGAGCQKNDSQSNLTIQIRKGYLTNQHVSHIACVLKKILSIRLM
jgi:hypothetical protein